MSNNPSRYGRSRPEPGAGGVRDRLGGLFAKAATRASEGAERLREAAGAGLRPSIVQHAQAARERGNLEAAFWLLDEAFRSGGTEDREAVRAFWDVALALDRAPAAAAAGVALIEASASEGLPDVAARHFVELTDTVPEARVSPPAVARMLPPLCARIAAARDSEARAARDLACLALRHALHESESGETALTPGLAVHLFKEAREIDPEAARRTAEIALSSPGLHEVKRAEFERYLAGEEIPTARDAGPPSSPPLACDPDASQPALEVDPEVSSPALEVDPEVSSPELEIDGPVPEAGPAREAAAASGDADEEAFEIGVASSSDGEAFEIGVASASDTDDGEAQASELAEADFDRDEEPVLPPLSHEEVVDAARRLVDRHGPLSTEPAPPPAPEGLKILRAEPVAFEEHALLLRLPGGRSSRVGWKEIQALSVAEISGEGGTPQVLVDCILNWRRRDCEPLRVVRLYTADFEPSDFVDSDGADLSSFLTDLFERCQAAPLPDPESALGVRIAVFEDLDRYHDEVLQV